MMTIVGITSSDERSTRNNRQSIRLCLLWVRLPFDFNLIGIYLAQSSCYCCCLFLSIFGWATIEKSGERVYEYESVLVSSLLSRLISYLQSKLPVCLCLMSNEERGKSAGTNTIHTRAHESLHSTSFIPSIFIFRLTHRNTRNSRAAMLKYS